MYTGLNEGHWAEYISLVSIFELNDTYFFIQHSKALKRLHKVAFRPYVRSNKPPLA